MDSNHPVTGTNKEGLFELKLSPEQINILKQVVVAQELAQTIATPGFQRIKEVAEHRLNQIERQFLNPSLTVSKDVAWLMRERLIGIREFWDSVIGGVEIAVETLTDRESIKTALEVATIDPVDLDGEVN